MNIAIKSENMNTRQALAGKVSLITGSMSGIGLGIARALAAAGSEVATRLALPTMLQNKWGRIIALQSGLRRRQARHTAVRPAARLSASCASVRAMLRLPLNDGFPNLSV